MDFHTQFERLSSFLINLECLDAAGQRDAFVNEILETGGSYTAPRGNEQVNHLFEIALHGIIAYGSCERAAIREWVKSAREHILVRDIETETSITIHRAAPDAGTP